MFRRLRALILKELQVIMRNPQSRNLIIFPVLVQLAVFSFAATLEVKNAKIAVLNLDSGSASVELIQRIAKAKAFSRLSMAQTQEEFAGMIDRQDVLLGICFSDDFSRLVKTGNDAPVQVILDGRHSNSGQIALGYVQTIIRGYAEEINKDKGYHPLSSLNVRNLYNPNLEYQWFIVPSLIAIITTISFMMFTALAVAREREQGTFDQLLVTPITPAMIIFGKAVPAMVVALIQGSIIFLAAISVYGIPFTGSILLLYLGMIFYGLALMGFGFFISSICSTQQQAFLGAFAFIMPAIILSGFVSPIENMPIALQWISWCDPLRHFIVIVKGLFLKNFTLQMFWEHSWPMLVIATIGLTGAYAMFRRTLK